jgi:GGDEF domain-containing protein
MGAPVTVCGATGRLLCYSDVRPIRRPTIFSSRGADVRFYTGVPVRSSGALALGDAHRVGRKLVEAVSIPVELCGATVRVGASIGIAVQAPTPEELIKEADHWMHEARKSGRGCVLPLPPGPQQV